MEGACRNLGLPCALPGFGARTESVLARTQDTDFYTEGCRGGTARSLRRRDDWRGGRLTPPPCWATVGRQGHLVSQFDSQSRPPRSMIWFVDSRSLDYSKTNGGNIFYAAYIPIMYLIMS